MNRVHHEDRELLIVLLAYAKDHDDALNGTEHRAFTSMREGLTARPITAKQRSWLMDVCERVGIIGSAPAENAFSALAEKEQKEHLRRADRIVVNSGPKVLKPPVKCK